jgi:hypothetical protein
VHRSRRPAIERASVLARLIAALVLVAQAAAFEHAAVVPHVTCAEHGEGVHLPVARHVRPLVAGQPATVAAAEASSVHGHDHCGLQHQGRTPLPVPAPAFVPVDDRAPPAPGRVRSPESARVLSFAPKTSPPRAAA